MIRDLIDNYSAPEIFVDGFANHTSHDGVMTCVGYRRMPEGLTVVIRLVWPAVNTVAAVDDAIQAMTTVRIGPRRNH